MSSLVLCSMTPSVTLPPERTLWSRPIYSAFHVNFSLILNRRPYAPEPESALSPDFRDEVREVLFVCSCLYREGEEEMAKLLTSYRLLAETRRQHLPRTALEFHIVFD